MDLPPQPSTTDPSPPDPPSAAAALLAELDASLADAVKQASSRAEHMRLVRMQGLVFALYGVSGEPAA